MNSPRPPISWTPCPYCAAKAHERCRPKHFGDGAYWPPSRAYPMGRFHKAREKAAGR